MEPGTLLSLDDGRWLQPLPEGAAAAGDEYVVLLLEDYVAFADGEIARLGAPGDDLELFEGMLLVPEEVLQARPPAPGRERQRWAQEIYREYIGDHVRRLRNPPPPSS